MAFFKRIGLFLIINILVVITVSMILSLLGVQPYLTAYGLDYSSLAVFCLVWGMVGSLISLALSRIMAKWMMGVQLIDPNNTNVSEQKIIDMVYELAAAARLPKMPQVGIYNSPDINAFATGPTKSRSLVAVSSGLLNRLNIDEVKGVIAHEISHIANGDMVTMALIQGIVNAFVMFLSRVIAFALTMTKSSDSEERSGSHLSYFITQIVLEIVFMIIGSMVVAWFSRKREFKADAGGAKLAGAGRMIQALEALKRNFEVMEPESNPSMKVMKISSQPSKFLKLFSTHPPLDARIDALKTNSY